MIIIIGASLKEILNGYNSSIKGKLTIKQVLNFTSGLELQQLWLVTLALNKDCVMATCNAFFPRPISIKIFYPSVLNRLKI